MVLESEGSELSAAMRRWGISQKLKSCINIVNGAVEIDPNCYSNVMKEFWNSSMGQEFRRRMSESMKRFYKEHPEAKHMSREMR